MNLPRILAGVTAAEAMHVYNALAQWVDNERNGLEETDEDERDPKHVARVEAVEAVVARMELELITIEGQSVDDVAPGAILNHDREAPLPYAVWLDDDIIGAGRTANEAIAEARAQVREWEGPK